MTTTAVEGSCGSDDVGQLLIEVQDDLQQLRSKLLSQRNSKQDDQLDLSYLENAIRKTEKSLKARTEQAFSYVNNHVMTLPEVENGGHQRIDGFSAVETVWRIKPSPVDGKIVSEMRPQEKSLFLTDSCQVSGLTPGQQLQHVYNAKIIGNPQNVRNREVLNSAFKIQLPLINERKAVKPLASEVTKGSTVGRLAVLPQTNRIDSQVVLTAPDENDSKKGILSLIDRGFIPPGAQLDLDPPPIKSSLIPIHKQKDRDTALKDGNNSNRLVAVKFDVSRSSSPLKPKQAKDLECVMEPNPPPPAHPRRLNAVKPNSSPPAKSKAVVPLRLMELASAQPQPPPTTPLTAFEVEQKRHRFAIQNGRLKEGSADLLLFKQHYSHLWSSVSTVIRHLERQLQKYSVPIAFIDGDKLADISFAFELEQKPTIDELLEVIINREEVEGIIRRPGNRYKGANGKHLAAAKIQATYRMHGQRREYREYRRRKRAAGVIAMSWIMFMRMLHVRKQLKAKRLEQVEAFRKRTRHLATSWHKIKQSKRVIVHIPSLGYSESQRKTIGLLDLRQNRQMSRLCDLQDPNVDVIYVSPVPTSSESTQYYGRLVGLKPAIDSGNAEDQSDLSDRYTVIVPDAVNSFPNHRLCLSSLLKYSPRTLKRIRNLIRGREAFIVTGMPNADDLYVADFLGVGILCPEPELAHLYSTKSGSKRVFDSAGVTTPPGEYDVYSLHQLYETLTQLIIDNLHIGRWLLKIDDEFDGRGIVCLDVFQHLKCYHWVLKESVKYGEEWNKKWTQENSYSKVFHELPQFLAEFAIPVNRKLFTSWDLYLREFLSLGGVIEACPPSDSVTALSVNMLIESDGATSVVSSGDQIHTECEFRVWGYSVPQCSVPPDVLNEACLRIGDACRTRAIVGYFTVDFVTFFNPRTAEQELWATDLDLKYGDLIPMHHLLEFVTGGKFDASNHLFSLPHLKPEERKRRPRGVKVTERVNSRNRSAVLSLRLYHSNLSMVQFGVFFQMCRAHKIGYDVKEKNGTVFLINDSTRREHLGMITIEATLQDALSSFANNLSVVHQEVSAPNLQGKSDFKAAILALEGILGMTVENYEIQMKE